MTNCHCRIARVTPKNSALVVHISEKTNDTLVEKLSDALDAAKEGRVMHGAFVLVYRNGDVLESWSIGNGMSIPEMKIAVLGLFNRM